MCYSSTREQSTQSSFFPNAPFLRPSDTEGSKSGQATETSLRPLRRKKRRLKAQSTIANIQEKSVHAFPSTWSGRFIRKYDHILSFRTIHANKQIDPKNKDRQAHSRATPVYQEQPPRRQPKAPHRNQQEQNISKISHNSFIYSWSDSTMTTVSVTGDLEPYLASLRSYLTRENASDIREPAPLSHTPKANQQTRIKDTRNPSQKEPGYESHKSTNRSQGPTAQTASSSQRRQ